MSHINRGFIEPWTVAVKGGGGVKKNKYAGQQANKLLKEQRERDAALNKQRQQALAQQKAQQAALFKKAQARLSQFGQASRQRITEGGEKQTARGTQSLVSRGLYNTTILDSFKRGVQGDVQRGLTDVDERVAGRSSGLFAQEAGMQLGQGQFQLGGIDAMSGGLEDYVRLLTLLGGGLS